MDKIRASGVKCEVIVSSDAAELAQKVNAWMQSADRAELVGMPQYQAGPQLFTVAIFYTVMSEGLGPPAPCE